MKRITWFTTFLSVVLSANSVLGVAIGDLRQYGDDGVIDEITGVVVMNLEHMDYHMGRFHIEDASGQLWGGIMVVDEAENAGTGVLARSLTVGDSVTLYNVNYESGGAFGNDALYFGASSTFSVTPNVGVPEAVEVTSDQLFVDNMTSIGAEYQSMLIKVNQVAIDQMGIGPKDDNYAITDADGNVAWVADYANAGKLFSSKCWDTAYHHYTCLDTPTAAPWDPLYNPISDDGHGGVGQYFASVEGLLEKQQDSVIDPTYSFYQLLTIDTESFTLGIPGDANGDGQVDGSDVTILANNWQSEEKLWWDGDFNNDGVVDGSDVTILAAHWQEGVTAAAATVPEPQTWTLMTILLLSVAVFVFTRQ